MSGRGNISCHVIHVASHCSTWVDALALEGPCWLKALWGADQTARLTTVITTHLCGLQVSQGWSGGCYATCGLCEA